MMEMDQQIPGSIQMTAFTDRNKHYLRDALGRYASGITVIASHDEIEPFGFTCQSFHSVSLEPPLVSFSVMVSSSTYPRIRRSGNFSVNILSNRQKSVSSQFSRKGVDKWAGISWSKSENGNPIIDGSITWLDCSIVNEIRAGDHYIVVGIVRDIGITKNTDEDPLLYFRGNYHSIDEKTES